MQPPPGCRVPRRPLPSQEQGGAPQQEAAPGPQLLIGSAAPAPLLPVPLISHRSRSIFLVSSRRVPSVLEDKNKAAGWGPNFGGERGIEHPVTPHTGGGMREVLLSSIWHPASATSPIRRAPEAGDARTGITSLWSWEGLCCTPLLTAAPDLRNEELCEPPVVGCRAGSRCTTVFMILPLTGYLLTPAVTIEVTSYSIFSVKKCAVVALKGLF